MHAIRMLEDAEGSTNGYTTQTYTAGEVYSRDTHPAVDDFLMRSFTISGRAVEVDAQGNPVGKPVDRRAYKAAHEPQPAPPPADTAESAATANTSADDDEGYNSPMDQVRRRRR